ncbi:MAG: hypothetical protein GF417_07135 [Candidatus Latescibacteria bacterium]|nr:hypothetical protein [bacterium]MBD3424193.1 hypothetical protein [Candidatus Latescibacterota bacterium]
MYLHCRLALIFIAIAAMAGCAGSMVDSGLSESPPLPGGYTPFQRDSTGRSEAIRPVEALTLEEALSRAMIHNPALKAYSWNVRAADARRNQVSLWSNPELEVEFDEIGGRGELSGFDGAEMKFLLSHQVELGGKRGRRIEAASMGRKAAVEDYRRNRLLVHSEVVKRFTGVLAAQEYVQLTGELLDVAEEMAGSVAGRVEAGKDAELEKIRAGVFLSNMKIRQKSAERKLQLARKRLAAMWAQADGLFDTAKGELGDLAAVPAMEELVPLIDRNPRFVIAEVEYDRRRAMLNLEKAQSIPDITLSGGMKRFRETDMDLWVLGISVPIPLFNRNQGSRAEAVSELERAREELEAVRSRVRLELEEAWSALLGSYQEAVELRENVLAGADKVYLASVNSYRRGKTDYLHVLDAQRTMFEVRKRYIDILKEYHAARADLKSITGWPSEGFQTPGEGEMK